MGFGLGARDLVCRPQNPVVEVCCRHCGSLFYVCRRCWRGQAYCSHRCRQRRQRRLHREAQARYRQTWRGKIKRALAEKRRRQTLRDPFSKNVGDASSTHPAAEVKVAPQAVWNRDEIAAEAVFCRFCGNPGVVVARFGRRGYGGKGVG